MAETIGLADLKLDDDLDISYNPETYAFQGNPAPPPAGNYNLRVKSYRVAQKDGQPIMEDGKYPVLTIGTVEIVEAADEKLVGRTIGLFHDIKTKPRPRQGIAVTDLADVNAAFDQTRAWSGINAGVELLREFLDTNATFKVRLDWKAYDKTFADAAFAAAGGRDNMTKDEINAVYNQAGIRGMKKFPALDGGRFNHIWKGPSGEAVEARLYITRFYPSNDTVRI